MNYSFRKLIVSVGAGLCLAFGTATVSAHDYGHQRDHHRAKHHSCHGYDRHASRRAHGHRGHRRGHRGSSFDVVVNVHSGFVQPRHRSYYRPAPVVVQRQTYAPRAYYPRRSYAGSPNLGNAVGGALGGYIGSQIGQGAGQLAATAAGAVAGYAIGGHLANPYR